MRKIANSLVVASVLALAAAQAPAAAQDFPPTVAVGIDVDAGTLDPRLARDTAAYRAVNLIYDGLVELTGELQPVPGLAESWENPEPTVWTFKLRSGVKFHDGEPLTAEDVVFTYETILDPAFNAQYRTLFTPIESIEAVDDTTVKFTLSEPYAPLLSYLDMGIVPKHLVERGADIGMNPVGTGPMKMKSWTRGSEIVLEANQDYWGGKPRVETLRFVIIANATARAQAFEAGNLDVIQAPLEPQDVVRLNEDERFGRSLGAGITLTYFHINTKDPLLSDPRVRNAIGHLIDYDTILSEIYSGVDAKATSVLLPSFWAYTDAIRQPEFDPEAAVAKLNELGWTDTNGDGILDKDGQKFHLVLSTHSEDSARVQTVEYLQAVFESVGIETELRVTDWPTFSTNYVHKGEHQISLLGWLNIVDPDRLLFAQLRTGGSSNWGGYSSPEVDRHLDLGRSLSDRTERAEAYQNAAEIIAEELPYIGLSYPGFQLYYNKELGELNHDPRSYVRNLVMPAAAN